MNADFHFDNSVQTTRGGNPALQILVAGPGSTPQCGEQECLPVHTPCRRRSMRTSETLIRSQVTCPAWTDRQVWRYHLRQGSDNHYKINFQQRFRGIVIQESCNRKLLMHYATVLLPMHYRPYISGTAPSHPARLPAIRRRTTRRRIPSILPPISTRRRTSRRRIAFLSRRMVRLLRRLRIRLAHLRLGIIVVVIPRRRTTRRVPIATSGRIPRSVVRVRVGGVSVVVVIVAVRRRVRTRRRRECLRVVLPSSSENRTEDPEPEQPEQ